MTAAVAPLLRFFSSPVVVKARGGLVFAPGLLCGAKLGGSAGVPAAYAASIAFRSSSSARCDSVPFGTSLPWASMSGMRPVVVTPRVASIDPSRTPETSTGTVMREGCIGGSFCAFGSKAENISVASAGEISGMALAASSPPSM